MPSPTPAGPSFLNRFVDVRRGETAPMLAAAVYFFFSLSSYFILRPIRDEMAVASGVRSLPFLFAGTLLGMLIANPLYATLVSRLTMKRFVSITYLFFAANLVVFYFLWRSEVASVGTGRVFFVWTSVYALFVPSVFWGVMADSFHSSQAKRLYGFIAVGGTLGSISGSAITSFFAERVGVANLLLVSGTFVLVAMAIVVRFPVVPQPEDAAGAPTAATGHERDTHVVGGSIWSGMTHVMRSPYLAGIAGFLLLYTLGSTVIYFAQTDIIGQFYTERDVRTAVLARIELTTQVITAIGQALFTTFAIRSVGLPVTLAAVSAVSVIGFAALGAAAGGLLGLPLLATFVVFSVGRRCTEFILTNPSRKILFTVVSREDKYKASSFLETFVYRAGDQIWSWGYAGLLAVGLTLTGISWITVSFSVVGVVLAVWLGRRQQEMAGEVARR